MKDPVTIQIFLLWLVRYKGIILKQFSRYLLKYVTAVTHTTNWIVFGSAYRAAVVSMRFSKGNSAGNTRVRCTECEQINRQTPTRAQSTSPLVWNCNNLHKHLPLTRLQSSPREALRGELRNSHLTSSSLSPVTTSRIYFSRDSKDRKQTGDESTFAITWVNFRSLTDIKRPQMSFAIQYLIKPLSFVTIYVG